MYVITATKYTIQTYSTLLIAIDKINTVCKTSLHDMLNAGYP